MSQFIYNCFLAIVVIIPTIISLRLIISGFKEEYFPEKPNKMAVGMLEYELFEKDNKNK